MALKKSKKKENKKATKKSAKKAVKKAAKKTAGKPAKKSAPVKQRSILSASVAHKKAPASAPLAPSPRKPSVGDSFQDFAVVLTGGKKSSLSSLAGPRGLVLYFYPKDDTPTCTTQACNLRDNYSLLTKQGLVVIGVSVDSVKSHKKFETKHELPFLLVADEDKKIVEKYGVWGEKLFMGKTIIGTHRTTFLIDETGKIRKIISKPKSKVHTEEILNAWKEIG